MSTPSISQVLEVIQAGGVVAIVRLDDLSSALKLAQALLAGGIRALEFTQTNPQANQTIAQVRAALPAFERGEAVIGAGSVLSAQAAQAAIEAGAQFVVSPTSDLASIARCRELGVACMPGAFTPTEILAAWNAGASAVKVFPARTLGPNYIKDLREPLPFLKLMPTGGIGLENIGDYIRGGVLAAGVGGNLVDRQLVAREAWAEITARASALAEAVRQARGAA